MGGISGFSDGGLAQPVVEGEELFGGFVAGRGTNAVELVTGCRALAEVDEQLRAVHLQVAVVGAQTQKPSEPLEGGGFVAFAFGEIGSDGKCRFIVGAVNQRRAKMEEGFVALSALIEVERDEAVGARIPAIGFQYFAQGGEGLFVLVQPTVGFTLKKEEGVALIGGEDVAGGETVGGRCEGVHPLHEGAILPTAGEALGERHAGFAVVGAPREEGAEPLFGIVPRSQ